MKPNQIPPLHHNLRLTLEYVPAETIQPNPRDPRVYSRAEKRRVAKSITTFGAMPLIVTSERMVLSGNIWLEASVMAGVDPLPIIMADHLTAAQAEAFMVAQVRLIERGEWDEQKLGEILRDLTVDEIDFDVQITGFDPPEIDLLIEGLSQTDEGPDPADEPAPKGPAVTRDGDVWLAGAHRVICGDALNSATYPILMAGELADIVATDPPYNVKIAGNVSGLGSTTHCDFAMASGEMTEAEFTAFLVQVLGLAAAHSADGSLAYWFIDWRHMHEMTVAGRSAYGSLQNLCIWTKTNGGMGAFYRSQHELVFVFKKGHAQHRNNIQLGRFGRNRTNVWSYPGANTFARGGEEGDLLALHPTVKPVALVADILLDASVRGDLVLDPFLGSGSTLIAAEKVGRRARGIELDPLYVDAAVRRWQRWTGEDARLEAGGLTFAEVEAARNAEVTHGE